VLEVATQLVERLEPRPSLNRAAIQQAEAHVLAFRGRPDEALHLAEQAVDVAREAGSADAIALCFSVGAQARLASGDSPGAAQLLTELEGMPNARATLDYAWRLAEMVRTAVASGEVALAQRLVNGVEPLFPLHEHALCAARAILAEVAGEHRNAAGLYADAAGRWQQFGFVPERAEALLGRGRCLLALGEPGAEEPLSEARELFVSMGHRSALDEAQALLEQTATRAT